MATRLRLVTWMLAAGCTPRAFDAEVPEPPSARESAPIDRPSQEPEEVCAPGAAITTQPSLHYVARANEEPHAAGGDAYVGMVWQVARPLGLPALSDDGRALAYFIDGESSSAPSPVYDRAVVVADPARAERHRDFRLLEHGELLRALPDGESPTSNAAQLSRWRLRVLEERVKGRVEVANEWLSAHQWTPMSVCRPEALVRAVRVGALRVSLSPGARPDGVTVEIRRGNGQPLLRQEEELGPCGGEPRLVSVATAPSERAVLVEVAAIPTASCSAQNRSYAYDLGGSPNPSERATLSAGTNSCAPARELTEDGRRDLFRYERSELSVFRVSPRDQLNLRESPGARARIVAKLPFLSGGLRHTGGACDVDGTRWLEVEQGRRRGWVSDRFVSPAAAFQRVETLDEKPPGSFSAATLPDLARVLRQALLVEQSKLAGGRVDVELLGHEQEGVGQIALFVTPVGSDSSSGMEYVAYALFQGGRWTLEVLELRDICSRGSHDGHCV